MAKAKSTKKNTNISLSDADLNDAINSINYIDSINAENNKNSITKSLLGGIVPESNGLSYINPASAPISTTNPLPSVQGGNATPVVNTQSQPVQGNSWSNMKSGRRWTEIMNQPAIDAATAKQETANAYAKDYNENQLPTLMSRANSMYKGATPSLDKWDPIQMNPVPVLPQAIIPEKIDIPNAITGSFGIDESIGQGNKNPSPREKHKTPTIVNPDYTNGIVNPLSPSSVFLDIQGGIRAAKDAGNPSLGRKATDDNFGTQIIPKGTMAKMPEWMFNKQTGKYDFKGINDVDVGGFSMANVAQRVATAWIAHNLMKDINAGKSFNVKVKDKNGNIVNKQIPLVSNYGQEIGASQLKFAPSVFVQALGGDYNTAIADAYTKTVDSLGLPSGSITYRPNSVVARRIEDTNSKAHQTWLGAKDNDMTGDTINGWGNSIINGLFGQMFGAK